VEGVRDLAAKALDAAEESHRLARQHEKSSNRQTFTEVATLLGEVVKQEALLQVESTLEYVEECKQEGIKYAEKTLRKEASRVLGPLLQDANLARDVHDWFNLIALVPVIFLTFANISCKNLLEYGLTDLPNLWTGEWWEVYWWTTFCYFILDLLFVVSVPKCVRSPQVIIGHHVATILYTMLPKRQPRWAWIMGACMTVEVNTWFLIARRVWNKDGGKPFGPGVSLGKSLRSVIISSSFYISWFAIRMVFYPILWVQILRNFCKYWGEVGTPFDLNLMAPIIQTVLVCLNAKWSIELVRSKMKGRGKSKGL